MNHRVVGLRPAGMERTCSARWSCCRPAGQHDSPPIEAPTSWNEPRRRCMPPEVTHTEWVAPTLGIAAARSAGLNRRTSSGRGCGQRHRHVESKTGRSRNPDQEPKSGPHRLTEDKAGTIWFARIRGVHRKLDPKTGTSPSTRCLDPAARDPHTPLSIARISLWFTLQNRTWWAVSTRDWRDQAHHDAPSPVAALRDGDAVRTVTPHLRIWRQPAGEFHIDTMARHRVHAAENPASRPRASRSRATTRSGYGDYSRGLPR